MSENTKSMKEGTNLYLVTYLDGKGRKMTCKKSGTTSEDVVRAFRASTKFKYIVIGVQEKK